MLLAFHYFARRDFQHHVFGRSVILGMSAVIYLELLVYWYTAKSFGIAFSDGLSGLDYFSFIVIGEASLLIPMLLLGGVVNHVGRYIHEGCMDSFLTMPVEPQKILILATFSSFPRVLFHLLILLLLAHFAFTLQGYPLALPLALVYQFLAVPAFLGLGLLAAAVIIYFGRGYSVIHYAQTGFAVLSGAYFPISVFPEFIQRLSSLGSPLTLIISGSREVLATGTITAGSFIHNGLPLILWGLVLLPLGYLLLGASLFAIRKSGRPLYLY